MENHSHQEQYQSDPSHLWGQNYLSEIVWWSIDIWYDIIDITQSHFFNQFKLKAFLCVIINDFSWFMFNHQDGVLLVLCPPTHCWMVSSVWCPSTHWCGCVLPPWCPPTHWCQKRRSKLPGHPRISHKIIKSTIFLHTNIKTSPKSRKSNILYEFEIWMEKDQILL